MAILNNNPLVGASGNQGGYNINNSLRFRSSASAYLNRTPTSAGSQTTWTISAWVKRGSLGTEQHLFDCGTTVGTNVQIGFLSGDGIYIYNGNNTTTYRSTSAVFRDPSSWYHLVIVLDTSNATAASRCRIYVNGVEQVYSTSATITLNSTTPFNSNIAHNIGRYPVTGAYYFDGYLTEVNFIDGQALTPSSFGETDTTTGVWKPKAYSGTYGTNGFYLKFSDIATTSGSNAGLGKDFSGNSNYWTTNNISVTSGVTYDAMTDVPTNTSATVANYCVLNPLDIGSNITISDGNLKFVSSSSAGVGTCRASMAFPTTGKWYFEVTAGSTANANTVGVANSSMNVTTGLGDNANGWGYSNDGYVYNNGAATNTSTTWGNGDIAGIAFDADSGKLWFAKNNTWVLSGNPSSGTNPAFTGLTGATFFPAVSDYGGGSTANLVANFGQRPFAYTPPTGYVALNTFNLPTSTILQGNKYMDATLYDGNSSTQTVTNAGGFKPDMVWMKARSIAYNNLLHDSVRGVTQLLIPNGTDADQTVTDGITSFNSNGFSLGANGSYNQSTRTYVGWQWQAGQGSTSSNTSGSITSTVSVNTTAGFSVVTYTGNGTAGATIGHGLGVAPSMVIIKRRNASYSWAVLHTSVGFTGDSYLGYPEYYMLYLDSTMARSNFGSDTIYDPTSTTIRLGSGGSMNDVNASGSTYVAYCWAEIAGFSKFGSYTGNGSTDGPFVFTNLKPRFIMIKRTDSTSNWTILDTAREGYNVDNDPLYPNLSNAEGTTDLADILSNGFKLRSTDTSVNANAGTYIYACFSSNPFKNSTAV